jgi:hypothetical protein
LLKQLEIIERDDPSNQNRTGPFHRNPYNRPPDNGRRPFNTRTGHQPQPRVVNQLTVKGHPYYYPPEASLPSILFRTFLQRPEKPIDIQPLLVTNPAVNTNFEPICTWVRNSPSALDIEYPESNQPPFRSSTAWKRKPSVTRGRVPLEPRTIGNRNSMPIAGPINSTAT